MKEIKQNETGRSMVEMLGVLAIIGVLSITAVSGYRWAMDKMAANDIVNEVKKRAVVASQQRILGNPLDLTEFDDTIRDTYAVIAQNNYKGSYFAFTLAVDGISKAVCEKLIDMDWMLPVAIDLNNAELTDASTCDETNTVLYVFNNDLRIGDIAQPGGTDGDIKDDGCPSGYYLDLNTNECVKSSCPAGQFLLGSGNCVDCPTASNPNISLTSFLDDNSCTSCSGSRVLAGGYGFNYQCSYCPSPHVVCGTTCCEEGKVCQYNSSSHTYSCVSAQCTSDAACKAQNAATPLCDTYTGTCFVGCRENSDCTGTDQFCDLDVSSTGRSCTQKPGRGTCKTATGTTLGNYTRSTDTMNWWSAENFCKAIGRPMADPTTECTADEWTQFKAANQGACAALNGFETGYYPCWTKRLMSNCDACLVSFRGGSVYRDGRDNYSYYALCK